MHDIATSGPRFSDHFYGKPPTNQAVAGSAAKSYFGSFNDKLRGKNEKHCDQYPDDVADRQRQTSDR